MMVFRMKPLSVLGVRLLVVALLGATALTAADKTKPVPKNAKVLDPEMAKDLLHLEYYELAVVGLDFTYVIYDESRYAGTGPIAFLGRTFRNKHHPCRSGR
jgi:hypothetical protein